MFSHAHKKRGVTLVEIIVYVAIFSLVFTVIVNTIVVVLVAYGEARVRRTVNVQGAFVMERIMHEIRLAHDVNVEGSSFGTSSGRLLLETVVSDVDETPIQREFYFQKGTIILRESSGFLAPLTTGVVVTSLTFYHVASSTNSKGVRVKVTVEGGVGKTYSSQALESSAVLRRSYGR